MSQSGKKKKTEEASSALKARIVLQPDHPISNDQLDRSALNVLRKLQNNGFSGYLVGGGVRDLYLGKKPKDFDISTDAKPGQIRKLFRNSRIIGRRFRLVQVFDGSGGVIEVSTLRSLSEHDLEGPEAVLAPNNTYGNLNEDAMRRDLTINSLFYEISDQTIIDYVGGVADLDNSIVRVVGEPAKRFNRDPVRILRAIRHAARTSFTIEKNTWEAICSHHEKLTLCPTSRLRDEIFKDLNSGALEPWLKLSLESGAFFSLFKFYEKILSSSDKGKAHRESLLKIAKTIDRVNNLSKNCDRKSQLSHDFLLALILIPWSEVWFALSKKNLKRAGAFHLQKELRSSLDQNLGIQLNLRKSFRQEMATLLANLPLFFQHKQGDSWPKWLMKKSYFKKCSLFYHFYLEATTGQMVKNELLKLSASNLREEQKPEPRKRSSSRKKNRPAFAPKGQKSIFGLKK